MRLNADFSRRAVVTPEAYRWVDSPTPGVERMMLDRIGEEVARATSLVRYAPNSTFPSHEHGGGEEILVLEGEFADEHGRYPAGSYLRNPIGTAHAPRVGAEGALLFVKLHQFSPDDTERKVVDTRSADWQPGQQEGLEVMPLHDFEGEQVALERWAPNVRLAPREYRGGAEVLVLEGAFHDEHGRYPAGSWLRTPHGSRHTPRTGADGALVYIKAGHLPSG
ncbi:cupin domain-containing protein [Halomonas heilongjiangensis]|uniref:Cupin n=1 Tax=Halomonas heilongjiangensis TaxID=1387883 RepID=A0A2N7TGG1_9GAMM|nr:cupin domain-containing protein [Halomonas heilongjiangensis]PMR67281.1 cupin [Halomonas heilongjiangensis]PXX91129.1 cupin [Halomonas heilongjiangensis]